MPLIKTSLADSIGTVSFDRDTKRNALSAGLIAETIAALDDFKAKHARAVVLRSATAGKVWSAGHDIEELPKADIDPLPYSARHGVGWRLRPRHGL
jgi:methylmalonyl-CoA decarboxylase